MKFYLKLIILLLVFSSNSISLFSQFKFGIQGGGGISNYTGKDFPNDHDPKAGITAGFYFEREINLTMSFGFDLNYDQKGTFYKDYPHEGTTVSIDSRFSYLNLPIYAKAYFGKKANYYLYLGVSGSRLLNFEYKVNTTEYGYDVSSKPYFSYTYNQWDAAVVGGFGFNFYEIILDVRYNYGLVNVYEGHNVPSIRNSFISATIGYTLYKKKVLSCFNNRAY
jgi:hypothetical protein